LSLNDRVGCDNLRVYFAFVVSLQDVITRLLQASLSFLVGMTKFCTTNSFFDSKEQTLSNNSSAGSI
jgi:hypothetical protein